jgi:hypothetical protein
MKIEEVIIKENGDLASKVTFTFGFMDLQLRKMIVQPSLWLKAVGVMSTISKD